MAPWFNIEKEDGFSMVIKGRKFSLSKVFSY